MESILTEIIFFQEAFCFGEHFLESIFRGAFGGKHFSRSIWIYTLWEHSIASAHLQRANARLGVHNTYIIRCK